jgi:hypothetical protein
MWFQDFHAHGHGAASSSFFRCSLMHINYVAKRTYAYPFSMYSEICSYLITIYSDDIMKRFAKPIADIKRFIKPIADYIFQTYLYTMLRGYEKDLKKELQYVDIRRLFMGMRAE